MPFPIRPADIMRAAILATCKVENSRTPTLWDRPIGVGAISGRTAYEYAVGRDTPITMRVTLAGHTIAWLTRSAPRTAEAHVEGVNPATVSESLTAFRGDGPTHSGENSESWILTFHGPTGLPVASIASALDHVEPGFYSAKLHRETAHGASTDYAIGFMISTVAIAHPDWTAIGGP